MNYDIDYVKTIEWTPSSDGKINSFPFVFHQSYIKEASIKNIVEPKRFFLRLDEFDEVMFPFIV